MISRYTWETLVRENKHFVYYCMKGYLEIIKMASRETNKETECK